MNQQIALLRGINVGTAKRVSMKELQALVTSLGYTNVRTLLNSGNVVFEVPPKKKGDAARRIEDAMAKELGVTANVIGVVEKQLRAVIAGNPLAKIATDPSRYLVGFVADESDSADLTPLLEQDWAPEALAVANGAVYLWCAEGIRDSKLAKAVGKVLKDRVTMRNWATVLKLQGMLDGID
ncbi:MAG: DUF1697 domain-containing protein [Chthoniobacteraceae bacterium]